MFFFFFFLLMRWPGAEDVSVWGVRWEQQPAPRRGRMEDGWMGCDIDSYFAREVWGVFFALLSFLGRWG